MNILKSRLSVLLMATAAVACSDDVAPPNNGDAGQDAGVARVATTPSKGSSTAIDEDGTVLAVANKATGDITIFNLADLIERRRVKVGDSPVSVTFSPDGATLYVVNQASQSVSVVTSANTPTPTLTATIPVGSEPVQAALTPSGSTLYVTNWADGTVSVIDTATNTVTSTIAVGGAPYAVCISNNGDASDTDETIYVTDFYSRPVSAKPEGTDDSRQGRVFRISAGDQSIGTELSLPPIAVTGIAADIDAANTSAFANQLYSCALNNEHLYITAVGASPAPFENGTDFRQNVHGLVYAIATANGELDGNQTSNLSQLIAPLNGDVRFAAVPHDIAFVPGTNLGYIAVTSANSLLRVDFGKTPPTAGAAADVNFLETGASPTGVAIANANAYTYNEVGRSISHIDLAAQKTLNADIEAAQQPTDAGEIKQLRGQKFFDTGLGRWSTKAWVSCVACHPGGTTDNVTWLFPAGPRQTVDVSATFNAAGDVQRILNWTAIFDEIHDFELNTRGVAGGVGAIVTDPALDVANRINFVGTGGVGNPDNGFNVGSVKAINAAQGVLEDWNDIEAYIASLPSPSGRSSGPGDVAAGREVFLAGRCENCHGGPLWTSSERYYTPNLDGDLRVNTFGSAGVNTLGNVRGDQVSVSEANIAASPIIINDANGAPQRHLCSVRIVGTFGAVGPDNRGAAELRQNGQPAQGPDGFNIPSLLNVNLGAPYLHNGAAETLEALLDPAGQFGTHLQAGNQVFAPSATDITNLIAFLNSIDDTTTIIDVPAGQKFCPIGVVPAVP